MKRCPECGRDYNDDSMSFCLDDGSELLFGPASGSEPGAGGVPAGASPSGVQVATGFPSDEPQTAILHSTAAPGEAPTRAQIHTTEQTAVFPRGAEAEPRGSLGGLPEKHRFWHKKRASFAEAGNRSANRAAKPLAALVVAVLVLVGGFIGYRYFSPAKQIESIAVMPFVNESGNADVEYLSDGMTETLISSLTKIPNLSVMARSSVFYYKGKNTDPRQIGEELNVEAILLGRVTQRGDDLKISLELVDTKTLAAIWSETYNRKMNDLVTLQSEIARNVSDRLRLKLTATEQEKAAGSGTANSEAQQLYLKGLFHFNKRTGRNGDQEMEKGVDFFKQATGKDPNYALAFAGLAASYSLMPWYGDYDPRESLPKAKEAAQKSLELDPGLSEAHAVLGNILSYSYDWEGGERSYLKAIELNPKNANAHGWYADYFATKGLYDKALREYDKALEIDPLDQVAGFDKVRTLVFAERYDEAVSLTKKLIELFPENGLGPLYLDASYMGKGMEREAMEQWWIAMDKFGYSEAMIQEFKDVYKESGLDGLYRKRIEILLARVKTKLEQNKNAFVRYARIYEIYADLKDKEKTLEYMNKAYQQREMDLINLKRGRRYDFLKDEPEFQELLKKIGYPE